MSSKEQTIKLCVCLAITEKELCQLDLVFAIWHQLGSGSQATLPQPDLVITLPGAEDSALRGKITKACELFCIRSIFREIRVFFLGIPRAEDIYIRPEAAQEYKGEIPQYGLKSGPNRQFFESLKRLSGYSHTLLYETDMYAFTPRWISLVHQEIRAHQGKWIIGATYSGATILSAEIINHINGASIYATGSSDFQNFLERTWMPLLSDACLINPDTAYDILWSRVMAWTVEKKVSFTPGIADILKIVTSKSAITGLLINISLPSDSPMNYDDFEDAVKKGGAIVHSKNSGINALLYSMKFADTNRLPVVQYSRLALNAKSYPFFRRLSALQLKGQITTTSTASNPSIKKDQNISMVSGASGLPMLEISNTEKVEAVAWRFPKSKFNDAMKSLHNFIAISDEKKILAFQDNFISATGSAVWDFLIHEELLQTVIFQDNMLFGRICQGSYKKPLSDNVSFFHIFSISLKGKSARFALSANTFLTRSGQIYILLSSGQSHERLFIDVANSTCYSANKPSKHISDAAIYALETLTKHSDYFINKSYPSCDDIWINRTINGIALMPIANRPFLAVNDYLIAIDRLSKASVNRIIFIPDFFTFIDYRKLVSSVERITFVEIDTSQAELDVRRFYGFTLSDPINSHLLLSKSLLYVPRSITSTDSCWQPLKISAERSSDIIFRIWEQQVDKLPLSPYQFAKKHITSANLPTSSKINAILLDVSCEKRSWLDQVSAYVYTISRLSARYADSSKQAFLILFDGYTIADSREDPFASEMCNALLSTVDKILEQLDSELSSSSFNTSIHFLPLFGMEFLDKCIFYQNVEYFIVQVGTASLGISKCFRKFGRLIGPPAVLSKTSPAFQDSSSCIMTDPDMSVPDQADQSKAWDHQSYHISGYKQLIDSDISIAFPSHD